VSSGQAENIEPLLLLRLVSATGEPGLDRRPDPARVIAFAGRKKLLVSHFWFLRNLQFHNPGREAVHENWDIFAPRLAVSILMAENCVDVVAGTQPQVQVPGSWVSL